MAYQDITEIEAKSAAAQLKDREMAEVWFLTNEDESLRITLPRTALFALAQRITHLSDPQHQD